MSLGQRVHVNGVPSWSLVVVRFQSSLPALEIRSYSKHRCCGLREPVEITGMTLLTATNFKDISR